MRHLALLIALGAAILVRGPAQARNFPGSTYTSTMSLQYSTSNRSVWGNDAQTGVSFDYPFTFGWDKTGANKYSGGGFYNPCIPEIDTPFGTIPAACLGDFGLKGSLETSGTMGLEFDGSATGGSVNVTCPITVNLIYPKFSEKPVPGAPPIPFPVCVSFTTSPDAVMQTASPSAQMNAYFVARNMMLNGSVQAKAFGDQLFNLDPIFNFPTMLTPYSPDSKFFDTNPRKTAGPGGTVPKTEDSKGLIQFFSTDLITSQFDTFTLGFPSGDPLQPPIISGSLHFPVIRTSGSVDNHTGSLTSEGEDWFGNVDGNITNLVTFILQDIGIEVPPFNGSFPMELGKKKGQTGSAGTDPTQSSTASENSSKGIDFGLDYSFLNLHTGVTFGVKQTFDFLPQPIVQLEYRDATDPNAAWQTANFITPQDQDAHPITPGITDPNDPHSEQYVLSHFYTNASLTLPPTTGPGTGEVEAAIYMPASGVVTFRPKVKFINTFTHTIYLTLTGGIYFDVIKVSVNGSFGGHTLGSYDFEPIPELNYEQEVPFKLKEITPYALGAFTPDVNTAQTGPEVSLTQKNIVIPTLDSFSPAFVNEYSLPANASGCGIDIGNNSEGTLELNLVASNDPDGNPLPWPEGSNGNPDIEVKWDDQSFLSNGFTNANHTAAKVEIPQQYQTPGIHHVSVTAYNFIGIDRRKVFKTSTLDFPVHYLSPQPLQLFDQTNASGSQQIHSLPVGDKDLDLEVKGAGFDNLTKRTQLFINGEPITLLPNDISCDQILFKLPKKLLQNGGDLHFRTFNPEPGGGYNSASTDLIVPVINPTPGLSSLALGAENLQNSNPANVKNSLTTARNFLRVSPEGSQDPGLQVTVNGTGFVPGSQAFVNDQPRKLRFISSTQVSVDLILSDTKIPGTKSIRIVNPSSTTPITSPQTKGGARLAQAGNTNSNLEVTTTFVVNNPVPKIEQLQPSGAYVGQPDMTVTITGTDFVNGATVKYNGVSRPAQFVSDKQIRVDLKTADFATAGNASIKVTNGLPGGGDSNNAPFPIQTSAPKTTAALEGTLGTNGWYRSAVKVTLTAAGVGTAVNKTLYTLDGGAEQTYAAPFTITGDGKHTLMFWSVDTANAAEAKNTKEIDIDATAPTASATATAGGQPYAPGSISENDVIVTFACGDATSGVGTTPAAVTVNTSVFDKSVSGDCTDKAGNSSTATISGINVDKSGTPTPLPGNGIRKASSSLTGESATHHSFNASLSNADPQGHRYVAFWSAASNLLPGGMGTWDVFVKEYKTGFIQRASASTNGTAGNSWSFFPSISADGQLVAFTSLANNLIDADTNGNWDVFLHNGKTGQTTRASVSETGKQTPYASGFYGLSLSPDGKYLAFASFANDFVTGWGSGYSDIYVKELATGKVVRASAPRTGKLANDHSFLPSLSGDGGKVAFVSYADNFVKKERRELADVFVKDLKTGDLVRIDNGGTEPNGDSSFPAFSADGQWVAFISDATNLTGDRDKNGVADVFVANVATGKITRVNTSADGAEADDESWAVSISGDGRYVAFYSDADNLVPGDTNQSADVFVKDLQTGKIWRESTAATGEQGNNGRLWRYDTGLPVSISPDGGAVAFDSQATNLVAGDNPLSDVFIANTCAEKDGCFTK